MTERPRIAIIGSPWARDVNGNRLTDPAAIAHEQRARVACEELGREFAKAGCRLLVYSAEAHSIEADVVRGFVSVRNDKHVIEFRHPRGSGERFPEQGFDEEPICDRSDPADDWVVSFYRSLKDANGVLLLGGRATTAIAGHVAIAFELPVAAVAGFDGAAAEIWKELKHIGGLRQDEYDMMGNPWGARSAGSIVASLVRRHALLVEKERDAQARDAELARYRIIEAQRRSGRPALAITIGSFAAVLVLILLGLSVAKTGVAFLSLFISALTLAGVTGAGVRFLKAPGADQPARSFLYGAIAGFVFSILYLAPQWSGDHSPLTITEMSPSIRWQILIAPILALTGGLAADSVLAALQKGGETRAAQLLTVPLSPTSGTVHDRPKVRGTAAPRTEGRKPVQEHSDV